METLNTCHQIESLNQPKTKKTYQINKKLYTHHQHLVINNNYKLCSYNGNLDTLNRKHIIYSQRGKIRF